jgi:RecA/RadA recombinase
MSDNYFRNMVKELNDEYTNLLEDGGNSSEFSGWIDTGSLILNALISGSLYGGIPNNKITILAGQESVGKTFFTLSIGKHFLSKYKNSGILYYDTESALTKAIVQSRGVDPSRFIVSEPQTVQEFRYKALKVLDNYIPQKVKPEMMMVLDSLGQLSTSKEIEDTASGSETKDMTRAAIIKGAFRVLSLKLAKAKVPLIVTNHVYDAMNSMFPKKEMSGGSGPRYAASTILFLSKKQDKDGKDVVGNIISCKTEKSRFTKEKQVVDVKISFSRGLDKYYGLLDLAEKYDIIKKVSTRFEMPDGTKVFEKRIYAEPEKFFTADILARLEDAAKKEFEYGATENPYEGEEEDEIEQKEC